MAASHASREPAHSDKSFASPFRDLIEDQLARGRNAFGIYQQLVDQNGFTASYESVKRFVRENSWSTCRYQCQDLRSGSSSPGQN